MEEGNLGLAFLVTIILIALNGMLASAEIALMGLNELRLRQQADEGDKKAALLLYMKQNPSDFLSTVQIGITLAGLLSGAFAADTMATPLVNLAIAQGIEGAALQAIRAAAVVLITFLLTFFMLIFGELVPKRLAMAKPEAVASFVITPIAVLSKLTRPLVRLLAVTTNAVLRLLGVDSQPSEPRVTEEEILMMVRTGHSQGTIEEDEVEFVVNVFKATDLSVVDAMTHRTEIVVAQVDEPLLDVIALMNRVDHTKIPVCDGSIDNIVGILYRQDLASLYTLRGRGGEIPSLSELMRPPFFVPETKLLLDLFEEMKENKKRLAVVVDEYGGTSGLITLMDIVEEIVGDIESTYMEDVIRHEDGSLTLRGRIDMEDAAAYLKLEPQAYAYDAFDTLSGFLIAQFGYIPKRGEKPQLQIGSYRFTVLEVVGAMIKTVRVEKTEPDRPDRQDEDARS